jgi:hypothetical protein
LYTMARVLPKKSRNSRTWAARSWNWMIRWVRSSSAHMSLSLCLGRWTRSLTYEFSCCSSATASRSEPKSNTRQKQHSVRRDTKSIKVAARQK